LEKDHLFLVCPSCGVERELIQKHIEVATRYKTTPFIVLCKCGTSWDIQTGKKNLVPNTVIEQIRKYSESNKTKGELK
jgi:uncharacterized Zn finger protein